MKVRDDRNRPCNAFPAWSAWRLTALPSEVRKRVETRMVNLGAASSLEMSGTVFALIGVVLIALAIAPVIRSWVVLVWLCVWGATMYVIRLRYGRDRSHRTLRITASRRVLLAEERCASCAYLLTGIPAEGDGCTLCPECGAAWQLDSTDVAGTRALAAAATHPPETNSPPHTTASTGFPPNS